MQRLTFNFNLLLIELRYTPVYAWPGYMIHYTPRKWKSVGQICVKTVCKILGGRALNKAIQLYITLCFSPTR